MTPKRFKCPRCGVDSEYEGNPFRPFCSERCKLVDLGNWISGTYRIPTRTHDEDEDSSQQPGDENSEEP